MIAYDGVTFREQDLASEEYGYHAALIGNVVYVFGWSELGFDFTEPFNIYALANGNWSHTYSLQENRQFWSLIPVLPISVYGAW